MEEDSEPEVGEDQSEWIRHHTCPRVAAFHPGLGQDGGPDLHELQAQRITKMFPVAAELSPQTITDTWNDRADMRLLSHQPWVGKTIFLKAHPGEGLKHNEIHADFEQLCKLNSQGGEIILYYDNELPTSHSLTPVTVAAWKSYRLKRKTVNTLFAEAQALVRGVGSLQWHRFLLLEALHGSLQGRTWESLYPQLRFISVVDSKSVYDVLSKSSNVISQVDDKRTAIDLSLLRDEFQATNGKIRWIYTRDMLADPLTKECSSEYLR